ncbi:MAG TPA: DUF5777 family beta-barrel protein [Chitinophagales bacterium]|nr:hypothetical protein [Chitinophagales bacterium]HMZ90531.1 DUF5777 family beta-barrel protein [Chitinophagales bacterium]HNA58795.1 DUF5777 family beta-barrel protein [Chitinophagales bacterium]HNJ90657.1 DUF5777 family beta-barrel protein [Chitinophagales bacterium]HNK99123.1 DUF5777 family beta-barrel protein [Chitinophagales bacterium]
MQKLLIVLLLLVGLNATAKAQDDLLSMLGDDSTTTEYVKNAFKSSRVINGQSMEMIPKGALDFRILHRFGEVSGGAYEFFGLDQASMRMGFDYGILKNLSVGVGRSTAQKELDGFVKYRILQQSTGAKVMPFSLVYVGGVTCNGMKWADTSVTNYFTSRLAFYNQLVIGRKFNESITLQLSPTFLHRNLVIYDADPSDIYSLGVGGRVKVTRRIALTGDYFYVFNNNDSTAVNPLSIGVDIETGGHVFQLHFSNCVGMNERAFLLDTKGQWSKAEVRFGFNLSRIFQLADSH